MSAFLHCYWKLAALLWAENIISTWYLYISNFFLILSVLKKQMKFAVNGFINWLQRSVAANTVSSAKHVSNEM